MDVFFDLVSAGLVLVAFYLIVGHLESGNPGHGWLSAALVVFIPQGVRLGFSLLYGMGLREMIELCRHLDHEGLAAAYEIDHAAMCERVKSCALQRLNREQEMTAEMRDMIAAGHSPFDLERLQYVSDVESSKAIAAEDEPSIIISASGMCEAGRVLHHLQRTVESPRNMVIIVGWQAQHTLGRRIVERRRQVRIFGVHRDLRAEVVVLNGFSAHADQADLIRNAEEARKRGPLEQVILVHVYPPAQDVLRDELRERGFARVEIPDQGDRIAL